MDCNLTSQTEKGLNLKLATFQQLFNLMHPFEGKVFFFQSHKHVSRDDLKDNSGEK